jgi:hypothetical protein
MDDFVLDDPEGVALAPLMAAAWATRSEYELNGTGACRHLHTQPHTARPGLACRAGHLATHV